MPFGSSDERRRTTRKWIAIPVQIETNGSRIDGVTINISDSGVKFFAAANLPAGSGIKIAFRDPNRILVQADAVVRWRALYLYGVEFLNGRSCETAMTTGSLDT